MNIKSLEEDRLYVMLKSVRLQRTIRAGETVGQYNALPEADIHRWLYRGTTVVVDDHDAAEVLIIQGGDRYVLPIEPDGSVPLAEYHKPITVVGGVPRG